MGCIALVLAAPAWVGAVLRASGAKSVSFLKRLEPRAPSNLQGAAVTPLVSTEGGRARRPRIGSWESRPLAFLEDQRY